MRWVPTCWYLHESVVEGMGFEELLTFLSAQYTIITYYRLWFQLTITHYMVF